jgi:hypothetical protein
MMPCGRSRGIHPITMHGRPRTCACWRRKRQSIGRKTGSGEAERHQRLAEEELEQLNAPAV